MSSKDPPAEPALWAAKLSDEELRRATEFLVAEHRARIRRAAQPAALRLRPHDQVEMVTPGRRLPAGARGHVTEVRRSGRLVVRFDALGLWTVDATFLRRVAGDADGSSPPS